MEYKYDITEKEKCWYKDICDKSKCGENFCIRHYKMSCLLDMALMEGKQRYTIPLLLDADKVDLEPYTRLKEIQNNITDFVSNGKNLLIYSKYTGNGKSMWARKLLLSWFNSIWVSTEFVCRGMFIHVPRLFETMRENITRPNEYYQYVNDNIINADVIVWDELNAKDYSNFEHDYLLSVLDRRIALGKANIFTTNYDLPTITQKLGTRLASRIVEGSIKVGFNGGDKRSWGVNNGK